MGNKIAEWFIFGFSAGLGLALCELVLSKF